MWWRLIGTAAVVAFHVTEQITQHAWRFNCESLCQLQEWTKIKTKQERNEFSCTWWRPSQSKDCTMAIAFILLHEMLNVTTDNLEVFARVQMRHNPTIHSRHSWNLVSPLSSYNSAWFTLPIDHSTLYLLATVHCAIPITHLCPVVDNLQRHSVFPTELPCYSNYMAPILQGITM